MEEVEFEFDHERYGALSHREARLKQRHDTHVQSVQDAEIRKLAFLKLSEDSAWSESTDVSEEHIASTSAIAMSEAEELRSVFPAGTDIRVVANTLQVHISRTPYRSLDAKLQLPEHYPQQPLVTSLQSAYLPAGLLERLVEACNSVTDKLRGQPGQVRQVAEQLKTFVLENRLATAYGDLQHIKASFEGTKSRVQHAKQASGQVLCHLEAGHYYMDVWALVPDGYPAEALAFEIRGTNLPQTVVSPSAARARDTALGLASYQYVTTDLHGTAGRAGSGSAASSKSQRLAMAGKQTVTSHYKSQSLAGAASDRAVATQKRREAEAAAFVAKPSLNPVISLLWHDCVQPLGHGSCPVCEKRLLPTDPLKLDRVPASMQVLRVYCGHFYHRKCVEAYVSEPPFGKCCHTCGAKIAHQAITTDCRVLEARWASKQAKARELDDVRDFLL